MSLLIAPSILSADFGRLAELQRGFVANLVPYLKPGGHFVYAVCSMEPEEGEAQARRLVGLGLAPVPPGAGGVRWDAVASGSGAVATFPHRHGTDGFFAARLIKPAV